MDYGDNELVPYAGFPKENLFNVNYQHPKGESITMVSERAIEFFKECL